MGEETNTRGQTVRRTKQMYKRETISAEHPGEWGSHPAWDSQTTASVAGPGPSTYGGRDPLTSLLPVKPTWRIREGRPILPRVHGAFDTAAICGGTVFGKDSAPCPLAHCTKSHIPSMRIVEQRGAVGVLHLRNHPYRKCRRSFPGKTVPGQGSGEGGAKNRGEQRLKM